MALDIFQTVVTADIYKVAKVVPDNRCKCNQSDTWLSILQPELY